MRPIALDMDGFASFREPTHVDFSDADFFALVGPTGSGKSTIIDAMTFALFGSVPRWGRKGMVSLALAPTISRGTVKLVFEVADQRYVVARELRRMGSQVSQRAASLERLTDPRSLAQPGDPTDVLAKDLSGVNDAVERMLGLSYEDFCQCVVLPQGQFANFLHAKASERQEILLRLLGAEHYRQMMVQANQRANAAGQRADAIAETLITLADATPEAEQAARADETALAALGPALRAGRLSAAEAIAAGRAPRAGRGYAAHRLAARLYLPRPAGLGLAAPFAKPARTMVSLAAIAFGATAVIFAFGLHSSLSRAAASQTLSATVPVQIQQFGPGAGPQQLPDAAQDAAVTAALRAQPGTQHDVALYGEQVKIPGIAQSVNAHAFGGAASWIDYGIIAGHWYDAPGEVDVNTTFLTDSGLAVGDIATLTIGTTPVPVRIAGEVFDPSHEPNLYGSAQTLAGVANGPAVLAAVIAAPAAVALNSATVRAMAGTAHTGIPASFTQVFPPARLALLSLAALAIAAAGALLPAGWAARARPATALRAE